jgi:hypothetical protein
MNHYLQIALRVAFLLVLAYALASFLGYAQGFQVKVGNSGYQRRCRRKYRPGWIYTGMVGEYVETQGPALSGNAGLR